MRFTTSHSLICSTDAYWQRFFDEEFVSRLSFECLGALEFEVIEQNGDLEQGIKRRTRMVQPIEMPGVVKTAMGLGDTLTMVETGTFDAASRRWSYAIDPTDLADKLAISGEVWLEETGPGTIERIHETDLTVTFFAVGSMVERYLEARQRETQDQIVDYLRHAVA